MSRPCGSGRISSARTGVRNRRIELRSANACFLVIKAGLYDPEKRQKLVYTRSGFILKTNNQSISIVIAATTEVSLLDVQEVLQRRFGSDTGLLTQASLEELFDGLDHIAIAAAAEGSHVPRRAVREQVEIQIIHNFVHEALEHVLTTNWTRLKNATARMLEEVAGDLADRLDMDAIHSQLADAVDTLFWGPLRAEIYRQLYSLGAMER